MSKPKKKADLKVVKIKKDILSLPKPKKRSRSKKKGKVASLPKYIVVDGKDYYTPSALRSLRIHGSQVNNDVKLVIYTLYIRFNKKYKLKFLINRMYDLRDSYAFSSGKNKATGELDSALFKMMGLDADYYWRSDVSSKMVSIHKRYPDLQNFRFECFECFKPMFLKFVPCMEEIDKELTFLWEAREKYLEEYSSTTLMFGVFACFEPLTRFALINFDDLILDGGDIEVFKTILSEVKQSYDEDNI